MPEKKAATMLSEEIEKRTQLRLKVQTQPATGPAFLIGRVDQIQISAPVSSLEHRRSRKRSRFRRLPREPRRGRHGI